MRRLVLPMVSECRAERMFLVANRTKSVNGAREFSVQRQRHWLTRTIPVSPLDHEHFPLRSRRGAHPSRPCRFSRFGAGEG